MLTFYLRRHHFHSVMYSAWYKEVKYIHTRKHIPCLFYILVSPSMEVPCYWKIVKWFIWILVTWYHSLIEQRTLFSIYELHHITNKYPYESLDNFAVARDFHAFCHLIKDECKVQHSKVTPTVSYPIVIYSNWHFC